MLFIDYSLVFKSIIPSKLESKITDVGLETTICSQIVDFLTGRPQVVRIGSQTSSSLILNSVRLQGCMLSHPIVLPVLPVLPTHDCVTKQSSNAIIKSADDTTIPGLITDND